MEFFIKQNTDLPLLKMQIVKDGKQDYKYICDLVERSAIYFSMIDDATGSPKIVNASAGFVNKSFIEPNSNPEYYLYYKFSKNETNRAGRYRGEFTLISDFGTLIVPIAENLFINIPENILSEGCDDNCGEPGFPCCPDDPPLSYNFDFIITISPGSVVVDYELIADKPLITDLTFSFTNEIGVYQDDPIIINSEVKINSGEISGSTREITNYDYDTLNGENSIYNTNIVFLDRSISFDFETKLPVFKPPIQVIEDAILISDSNEYIDIGFDLYLSYDTDDAILTGIKNEYVSVGKNTYLSYKELFIDNAILVDGKDQYIKIGVNLYLAYKK